MSVFCHQSSFRSGEADSITKRKPAQALHMELRRRQKAPRVQDESGLFLSLRILVTMVYAERLKNI